MVNSMNISKSVALSLTIHLQENRQDSKKFAILSVFLKTTMGTCPYIRGFFRFSLFPILNFVRHNDC